MPEYKLWSWHLYASYLDIVQPWRACHRLSIRKRMIIVNSNIDDREYMAILGSKRGGSSPDTIKSLPTLVCIIRGSW